MTFCALSTCWGSKWASLWQNPITWDSCSYQVISSDFWRLFTWHQISWDGCYTRCKRAKYVTRYTYPSLSLCVCVCVRSTGLTAAAMAEAMKLQKMKLMAMNNIHGSQNGTESENEEMNSSAGQSHTYKDTLKVHWIILLLLTEEVWLKVDVF